MELQVEIGTAPFRRIAIVDKSGVEMGHVYVYVITNDTYSYWLVENLHVEERFRGRGLGERLMQKLEYEARQLGCGELRLTSRADRQTARKLYAKLGFEETSTAFKKSLLGSKEVVA